MDSNELANAVHEDPELLPIEKETTITFCKADGHASVYTEEAGLMRRLLLHPEFDVSTLRVNTDSEVRRVAPTDFDDGVITGVDGTLSIAALTIGTSPRATSKHADLVSEQVLR